MIVRIVAGGPEEGLPVLKKNASQNEKWIGVDRGALYLLARGITPDVALGDFDSVSPDEWSRIASAVSERVQFPAEKDETDLEIALNYAIAQKPAEIYIYGVTGGRLDHFFGAVTLLLKKEIKEQSLPVFIVDVQNELSVHFRGELIFQKTDRKWYYSFFALSKQVKALTLSGFKYPIENFCLQNGSSRCVSNELQSDKGRCTFESGTLLVVKSQDRRFS